MAEFTTKAAKDQDCVAIYETLKQTKTFVFVVFFRGHWCPFCMSYLDELESIREEVYKRNGAIMVVTAEDESKLDLVKKIYHGFMFSDPHHGLVDHLQKDNLINIAKTPKDGYPDGVAQPGVLVTKGDCTLYSWAIVPSLMNLGGAKDRPSILQIRDNVFAQLDGKQRPHKIINTTTFWQGIRFKIFGKENSTIGTPEVECK